MKEKQMKPVVTKEQMVKLVQRGVKFLNKVFPGWEKKINLSKLDLYYSHVCILGQLYGDFFNAVEDLGFVRLGSNMVDCQNAVSKYGMSFNIKALDRMFVEDKKAEVKYYKTLTGVWKEAIKEQRNASKGR